VEAEVSSAQEGGVGVGRKQKEGVYSDGPRKVYNKLNSQGPTNKTLSCPVFSPQVTSVATKKRVNPIPAKVRRQNQIVHKFNLQVPTSSFTKSTKLSFSHSSRVRPELEVAGVVRNPVSSPRKNLSTANSLSSAGAVLCCSPIGSTEIRNCNSRFIANHEIVTASKVWKGAAELGVEGKDEEIQYVDRILSNEKREEAARRKREQQNHVIP
jgi:hypothetical protein